MADRAEGLLKGDRNLGFADLAVFTGVERVVGELLQVVRASARELDDLGQDVGIEPDGRSGERLGDCPGRSLYIERPESDGLEEAIERPMGPMDGAEQAGRRTAAAAPGMCPIRDIEVGRCKMPVRQEGSAD